jgi:hypothetical protein
LVYGLCCFEEAGKPDGVMYPGAVSAEKIMRIKDFYRLRIKILPGSVAGFSIKNGQPWKKDCPFLYKFK